MSEFTAGSINAFFTVHIEGWSKNEIFFENSKMNGLIDNQKFLQQCFVSNDEHELYKRIHQDMKLSVCERLQNGETLKSLQNLSMYGNYVLLIWIQSSLILFRFGEKIIKCFYQLYMYLQIFEPLLQIRFGPAAQITSKLFGR